MTSQESTQQINFRNSCANDLELEFVAFSVYLLPGFNFTIFVKVIDNSG